MDSYDPYDGALSEAAEHDATQEWIGCPKCSMPINATIPIRDFGYNLLAHVYDLLEHASAEQARRAIGDVLPWIGTEMNEAARRNPYFWPLIQAREEAEEANRRKARKEPRRKGKDE